MSHVREREYRHHFTGAQVMLKKRSRLDERGPETGSHVGRHGTPQHI